MAVHRKKIERPQYHSIVDSITCDVCGNKLPHIIGFGDHWPGGGFELRDIYGGDINDPKNKLYHWDLCRHHAEQVHLFLTNLARDNYGRDAPEPLTGSQAY